MHLLIICMQRDDDVTSYQNWTYLNKKELYPSLHAPCHTFIGMDPRSHIRMDVVSFDLNTRNFKCSVAQI